MTKVGRLFELEKEAAIAQERAEYKRTQLRVKELEAELAKVKKENE